MLSLSCSSQKKTNYIELKAVEELRDFNDSIFFGSIVDIEYNKDNYFLVDQGSNSIIITDKDFSYKDRIVRTGGGPEETISTYNMGVDEDRLALQDLAGGKFLFLNQNNRFINSFKTLFDASEFIYDSNQIIGQLKGEVDLPLAKINEEGDTVNRFGLSLKAKEGFPRKHLVKLHDKILAVYKSNFPYVEIYDKKGNHLKTRDLSSIPIFSSWLKTANIEEKIKTSTKNVKRSQTVFADVNVFEDKLYLSTPGIPYTDKKLRGMVIELSLDEYLEFKIERQLILEEMVLLTTFLVTEDGNLTGFDPINGSLRKYKID